MSHFDPFCPNTLAQPRDSIAASLAFPSEKSLEGKTSPGSGHPYICNERQDGTGYCSCGCGTFQDDNLDCCGMKQVFRSTNQSMQCPKVAFLLSSGDL